MQSIGRTMWAIPEGYIPSDSVSDAHDLVSHEAACFLNTGDRDADVRITLFFENRAPVGPYRVKVPAKRTLHLRFNDLTDPAPVPRDTSYASIIEASEPVIVQYQARLAPASNGAAVDHCLPGRTGVRRCPSEWRSELA